MACANLYILLGVTPANITMFDKDGVLQKIEQIYLITHINTPLEKQTLAEAIKNADVFRPSAGNVLLLKCYYNG
jgi:malate dehydrogenase (oxaloacetate-decarboxylating)(NADP+)